MTRRQRVTIKATSFVLGVALIQQGATTVHVGQDTSVMQKHQMLVDQSLMVQNF
uniref:Uncharacterized protein n=1 Tax=Helianthus annuus TaxID=4232 RepID=A0A251UI84_HELAN